MLKKPTLEIDLSLFCSLNLDGSIASLVTLESWGPCSTVTHEALLALQHQNWSVDQIEVVLASIFDRVNISKQMAGFLCPYVLSISTCSTFHS